MPHSCSWRWVPLVAVVLSTGWALAQTGSSADAAKKLKDALQSERTSAANLNTTANTPQHYRAGSAVGTAGTALESNEAVFTVMAGLNACGYDAGMAHANAARLKIRRQMAEQVAASPAAKAAQDTLCKYIAYHDLGDPAKTVGQYLSLALMMQPSADLELTAPIPQLPPDATQVAGVIPALKAFATAIQLHALWVGVRPEYEAAMAPLRDPITKQILETSLYLKEATSGNQDRRFVVIVEPMLANGLVNARVYGLDYLMVLAPPDSEAEAQRFQDDVKHFYLDFAIEPLIFGYPGAMLRLQPLLKSVAEAPVEEVYRDDVEALVSECLIRAMEARTMDTGIKLARTSASQRFAGDATRADIARQQQAEAIRVARVQRDVQEGFILTKYFYGELMLYEKGNQPLRDVIGGMVYGMDVDSVRRQARDIQWIRPKRAGEDDMRPVGLQQRQASLDKATGADASLLAQAQQSLSQQNFASAAKFAQQAIDTRQGDPGQAMYVLAQAHALQGQMQAAEEAFAQAITLTKDPHTVAWSHIYLGRIADIKQDRAAAIAQYKAALETRSGLPDAVAAAQQGLQQPYAVPGRAAPAE